MKAAFVTGVTGQDGSYLSELLLYKENYIKTFYYIYNNTNNIYEEKDIEKIFMK